jgi:hypothetical protein
VARLPLDRCLFDKQLSCVFVVLELLKQLLVLEVGIGTEPEDVLEPLRAQSGGGEEGIGKTSAEDVGFFFSGLHGILHHMRPSLLLPRLADGQQWCSNMAALSGLMHQAAGMRCLEARVSMQGARDDAGRDCLASPFVLRLSVAACGIVVAWCLCWPFLTP